LIDTLNDLVSYICVYLNDVYTFQFIFKSSISAKCLNIAEFLHSSQDNSNQGYLKKQNTLSFIEIYQEKPRENKNFLSKLK